MPVAAALLAAAAAQATPPTPPMQTTKVYAVVANYRDTRAFRAGPAALRKILGRVSDFYAQGSGGAHRLVAEVHPTAIELPQARPGGRCRLPDKAGLSAALREAGIVPASYQALVLVVPPSRLGCPGGVQTWFDHHDPGGGMRRVPLAVSWSLTERYIAHEIIHTHGLGHANKLVCRQASLDVGCKTREYGNHWDLMGRDAGALQMLSAPLRARMGWTDSVVHVTGRATYTIGAATKSGGLPTAVEIVLPFTGNEAVRIQSPLTLWIEYRAPFGFDARMGRLRAVNFAEGAMVNLTGTWQGVAGTRTRALDCPPKAPCLLDMNPQTDTFDDAALAVGQGWTEPFTGTHVSVVSRTETTLTVSVSSP